MATASSAARYSATSRKIGFFWPQILLRITPSAHTLKGFRAWVLSEEFPEKLRVTFLNQEIYLDMSQEDLENHSSVKVEIYRGLENLNREVDWGKLYADGVLVSNEEADVSNNPDGVAVFWVSLEANLVRLVPSKNRYMEIEGSPDWILEVLSDSSVGKDTKKLREAYHRARIREYWLVDARGPDLLFQILHWRKSGYVAAPVKDGWQYSKVFGRNFRLVREPARRGLWKYTLLVKK